MSDYTYKTDQRWNTDSSFIPTATRVGLKMTPTNEETIAVINIYLKSIWNKKIECPVCKNKQWTCPPKDYIYTAISPNVDNRSRSLRILCANCYSEKVVDLDSILEKGYQYFEMKLISEEKECAKDPVKKIKLAPKETTSSFTKMSSEAAEVPSAPVNKTNTSESVMTSIKNLVRRGRPSKNT